MISSSRSLASLLVATLIFVAFAGPLATEPQRVTLPKSISQQTKALNSDFLLFPPNASPPTQKSPLLIFLHGGGGGRRPLDRFKKERVALEVQKRNLPLTVVIPQRTQNRDVEGGWQPDDLNLLLAYLIQHHAIDPDRVYLTGMSMGGAGTWFWANHSPQHFAAIAPIAAGGQTGPKDPLLVDPERLKGVPLWAFHGSKDKVCPHQQIEALVEAIKQRGGTARWTLYEGVGHGGIVPLVYQTDQLFQWLLEQNRATH